MATLNRLAREQCEKAFANYIIQKKINDPTNAAALLTPADVPVHVRKGKLAADGSFVLQNVDELPVPCIVLSCPRARNHEMDYPVCELHILCLTSVDERDAAGSPNAASIAAARFGYIAELLDETNLAAVRTALNKPAGTDTRIVKDFFVFGLYLTEDMGQETERHWIDHMIYEVHCIPTDDTDGDGIQ